MSVITFSVGVYMPGFADQTAEGIVDGIVTTATSTSHVVSEYNGTVEERFGGTGFGNVIGNLPHDGIYTSWEYWGESGLGLGQYFSFSGFSVAASTFANLVLNDQFETLLSSYIMAGSDTVNGSQFSDYLLGFGGNDTVNGNGGDDILEGGGGDDTINGGDGNDALNGEAGADEMSGNAGDDNYYVDNDDDLAIEVADEGTDTVLLDFVPGQNTYFLPEQIEILRNVSGSNVILAGNAQNNQIYGADGIGEFISGEAGDDFLNGGSGGGDFMFGGFGNDIFVVDNAGDTVTDQTTEFTPGNGIDEVRSSVTFSLQGTNTSDIENLRLTGTAAIDGTGNAIANSLTGNSAANTLNGGGGADFMRGGDGNDIYYVDNGGDRAIESSAAGGTDTVRSSASFVLGNYVENLQLTGAGVVNGTGNGLDNRVSGNNQQNILLGNAGDDVLRGNGGNDALYGGAGSDTFDGGSGEDWIEGGAGRDVMSGGADADTFVFRTGDFAGMAVSTSDRILDFSHAQGDQIRLNSIDANSANGGSTNEAFTFIGDSAFHHVAGELRFVQGGGNTYVYGDTNGDGVADFMIRLDGLHDLTGADFLL